MGYIVLILALILALVLWKNKKILLKFKIFFKKYKLLVILEIVFLIVLVIFNVFNNTVGIREKDPHSNQTLKYVKIKEGETYTYKTIYYEKSDDIKNMIKNYKEKNNILKIENVGINSVEISTNEIKKDYKYGTGFSYYGITSCTCGTPIIFEKTLTDVIRIIILIIIIIDLLLIILTKYKEENKK